MNRKILTQHFRDPFYQNTFRNDESNRTKFEIDHFERPENDIKKHIFSGEHFKFAGDSICTMQLIGNIMLTLPTQVKNGIPKWRIPINAACSRRIEMFSSAFSILLILILFILSIEKYRLFLVGYRKKMFTLRKFVQSILKFSS